MATALSAILVENFGGAGLLYISDISYPNHQQILVHTSIITIPGHTSFVLNDSSYLLIGLCFCPCPPTPSSSILYTAARVILWKWQSYSVPPLLKTLNPSFLTQNKSQITWNAFQGLTRSGFHDHIHLASFYSHPHPFCFNTWASWQFFEQTKLSCLRAFAFIILPAWNRFLLDSHMDVASLHSGLHWNISLQERPSWSSCVK